MSVVARLRQLHQASTQGEWSSSGGSFGVRVFPNRPHRKLGEVAPADAEWIVAAHEHWPALMDVAEAAGEVVAEWHWPLAEPPGETHFHDLVAALKDALEALGGLVREDTR